jgi:hypothetical protein
VKRISYKIMTLCVVTLFSAAAFIGAAHAANPYNISKLRIDELTIPTSITVQNILFKEKATFSRVSITIKLLVLGNTDGKGFLLTDRNGEHVQFTIADDHQMMIWHRGVVAYSDSIKIAANVEYDFIVYVKPAGIEVWYSSNSSTTKVLQYNYSLQAPFNYYFTAQRTGATFRNVIVKEQ